MTGVTQRSISSIARRASATGRRSSSRPLVGVLEQRQHAVGDQVAGGLVARDGEQQEEDVELELGERLAVDLGLEQHADEVVARVSRRCSLASWSA